MSEAITREEMYLRNMAGKGKRPAEPHTRKEKYLEAIAEMLENGTGGGGAGGAEMTLIKTISLTEPVATIYETFNKGYKHIRIEFSGLRQNNDSTTSKVVMWCTLNNNAYDFNKAFSLHENSSTSSGVVYGGYSTYGVIDIAVLNDIVTMAYQGQFGTSTPFHYCYTKTKDVVGDTINSLHMYLPSQNMAAGLVMKIYGVA